MTLPEQELEQVGTLVQWLAETDQATPEDQIAAEQDVEALQQELHDTEALAVIEDAILARVRRRHPSYAGEGKETPPELSEAEKRQLILGNAYNMWYNSQRRVEVEGDNFGFNAINLAHEAQNIFIGELQRIDDPGERDTTIRSLFGTLKGDKRPAYVSFAIGVINEIVLEEELQGIAEDFESTGSDTLVTVERASDDEDIHKGFDYKVVIIRGASKKEIHYDAKSSSEFLKVKRRGGSQSRGVFDSTYTCEARGGSVIVVSPEGDAVAASTLLDNDIATRKMQNKGEHVYVPSFTRNTVNQGYFRSVLRGQIIRASRTESLV